MSGAVHTAAVKRKTEGMHRDYHSFSTGFSIPFSIRAWRGLRLNEAYAAKLKKKLARKHERERAKAEAAAAEQAKKAAPKVNPFSVCNLLIFVNVRC